MRNKNNYTISEDNAKNIRMMARFTLHKEEDPSCKVNSIPLLEEATKTKVALAILDEVVSSEVNKIRSYL